MFQCYSTEQLERYLDAELSERAGEAVTVHVADCAKCQRKLEELTAATNSRWSAANRDETEMSRVGSMSDFLNRLKRHSTTEPGLANDDPVSANSRSRLDGISGTVAVDPDAELEAAPPGYEMIEEIGRGGMGVVFKAKQLRLNRIVALKMIPRTALPRQDDVDRFQIEARAIAQLQHPNIVAIHEIGENEGLPFFSLEYVNGGNLSQWLGKRPIPGRTAAELVETIARAVQYAHSHGVIHRDLKPSNILLSGEWRGESREVPEIAACGFRNAESTANAPGISQLHSEVRISKHAMLAYAVPKIADFGLAKRFSSDAQPISSEGFDLTLSGMFLGTPGYVAPEIAAGKQRATTTAVDVYGLGAILYECLTGRPPIVGETLVDTLRLAAESEPPTIARYAANCPRDLQTICMKALAKTPAARYPSALALADDLRHFLNGDSIVARRATATEHAWRWSRRRPALAALLALSALVLCVGFPVVTVLWFNADRAHRNEATERANADRARADEAKQRIEAESSLYASRIALADHALERNDTAAALSFLDRCVPASGQPDPRGWEWHYLHRRCNADLFPGMNHDEEKDVWLHAVAFYPDSQRLATVSGLPPGLLAGYDAEAASRIPGSVKIWDAASGESLKRLTGHRGAIWALAISSDGRFLATGCVDGEVQLRDATTFAAVAGPKAPGGPVMRVVFSPDGKLLAVAARGGLLLWDTASGQERFRFRWSTTRECHLAFDANGSRLFVNFFDGDGPWRTEVCDIATGAKNPTSLPQVELSALATSPDGKFLALSLANETHVQIWNADASKMLHRCQGHSNAVFALAFTKDGRLASAGDDRTIRIWNVRDGCELNDLIGHSAGILSLAFNGDGNRLASASKDGSVRLWNPDRDARGNSIRAFNKFGEYLGQLGFADDGREILVVIQEGAGAKGVHNVGAWRTEDFAKRRVVQIPLQPLDNPHYREFAFADGGRRMISPDSSDKKTIHIWNTATGVELAKLQSERGPVVRLAATTDGATIAYSACDFAQVGAAPQSELCVVDCANGNRRRPMELPAGQIATRLAFSPDGCRLAASVHRFTIDAGRMVTSKDGELRLWNARTGVPCLQCEGNIARGVAGIAFDPAGLRVAAVDIESLSVWETEAGKRLFNKSVSSTAFTGVAFSPDSRRIAAASMDNKVRLWDAQSGNELITLTDFGTPGSGHYGFAARVAFSPDGRYLATNAWDCTISLWDAGTK